MKKIALLLVTIITLASCSIQDDNPNYHLEVLPIETYTLPESFVYGQTYPITVTYKRISDCHNFEAFYYEKTGNTRIIGVTASVLDRDDCVPSDEIVEKTFNFVCTYHGSYIFKFYKGEDAQGNNIFDEVEVPVSY